MGRSPIQSVVQNPYDIASLRTVSPDNATHVVVFNYLLELPFGRGKRFLGHGGAVDKIVGGWQINGIQRYQSGLPISILDSNGSYSNDLLNTANFSSSLFTGAVRPNLTGAPILTGNHAGGTNFQLLNPAAFAPPPLFNNQAVTGTDPTQAAYQQYYANPNVFFGNAPPVLGGVRVLPYYSESLSLLKKTTLTERFALEFRAEFFNPLNRHRYFSPSNDMNASDFGKANVIDAPFVYDPRVIQLGLKLIY